MQGEGLSENASEWKIKRKMPLARISDFSILMVRGKFMLNEGETQQNETKMFIFNVENKIKTENLAKALYVCSQKQTEHAVAGAKTEELVFATLYTLCSVVVGCFRWFVFFFFLKQEVE